MTKDSKPSNTLSTSEAHDFIRQIVAHDHAQGAKIITRFPPEPNGYLHLGHAKAICTSFEIAKEFGGQCHLRFDDTNPSKEEQDFVDAIEQDVRWLGYTWTDLSGAPSDTPFYASGYFAQLYKWAVKLIQDGKAYVDLQTPEQIRENRGSFTQKGVNSPYRDASIEDNLARFDKMKNGEFGEGEAVLRAKIDMQSDNMNLRDPVLYRVMHTHHHQTGDTWCIYPMYDYAHPLSDAIEGISHSICTLEFADHRPLYDWLIDAVGFEKPPRQYEFARLNVSHVLTAKRKLKRLVDDKLVDGWDDPRMPTIAAMRRRGYPAEALRDFCARTGVSKSDGVVDFEMLEFCVRESLEDSARYMAVLNPVPMRIINFDEVATALQYKNPKTCADFEGDTLWIYPNGEQNERRLAFNQTIYIDKADYAKNPAPDYKRLSPQNKVVRLRNSFVIELVEVVEKDGEIVEFLAKIDLKTLGNNPEGYKAKSVIHWASAKHGVQFMVNIYDKLFLQADPAKIDIDNLADAINPNSHQVKHAIGEPILANLAKGVRVQFEREGYFIVHSQAPLIFNKIVGLKDGYKPK